MTSFLEYLNAEKSRVEDVSSEGMKSVDWIQTTVLRAKSMIFNFSPKTSELIVLSQSIIICVIIKTKTKRYNIHIYNLNIQ